MIAQQMQGGPGPMAQGGGQPMPAGAPQQAQPAEAPQPAKPGGKVSPQMVAQMKKVQMAAMKVLYSSKEVVQKILTIVRDAEEPAAGIVQATTLLLDHLKSQVKGIDPNFVYTAFAPLALMIAQLAIEAKIIEDDPDIMEDVAEYWRSRGGKQKPQAAPPEEGAEEAEEEPVEAPAPQGVVNAEMEA